MECRYWYFWLELCSRTGYVILSASIHFAFVNILVLTLELCSSTEYIVWHACMGIDVLVVEHYRIHNMQCMC